MNLVRLALFAEAIFARLVDICESVGPIGFGIPPMGLNIFGIGTGLDIRFDGLGKLAVNCDVSIC